jgi:hypothetical protein
VARARHDAATALRLIYVMFFKLRGWIMLLPPRTPPPQMDWTHRPLIAASPDCYRYVDATACSSHPKIPRWHRQLIAR